MARLAIGLALVFREVLISLFVGIWSGAFIAGGLQFESISFYFTSLWEVVEKYIIYALADEIGRASCRERVCHRV